MGQYQTFIIRFWTDDTDEVPCGHIQHVATGRGLYFRDIQRMLHFLDANVPTNHRTGLQADSPSGPAAPVLDGTDVDNSIDR